MTDQPTTTAAERVAEAIYESDRHNRHNAEPWADATPTTRAIYLRNAEAAQAWFIGWLETKFREAADWADNPACPDRATYLQIAGAHLGLIGDLDADRAQRLADPRERT